MGSGFVAGPATTGVQVVGLRTDDQSALTADQDSDGLPAWRELMRGTDPLDADTNDNGLTDGVEVSVADVGTNADEDGDGLSRKVRTRDTASLWKRVYGFALDMAGY
jgi:hypothetical protein